MVAPREIDWTGGLLGGRYRILRCLGRGGMGAVYEATQEDLGRRVAVKVLHEHLAGDADVLARFRREAQAAAALGHANIVQVTDFQARPGEPPFLVMEHLVGASLATTIHEHGTLAQARVAFIAQQMLSALAAAHAAGIIHRDLKPDNVFLTSIAGVDDIVKVLDFGVVKLLQATGPEAHLTTTGAAIGTPVYMAPEQARGRGVDARTDLYATGVCMYEALTGRLPHDPPSYSALIAAILEEPPRALREHRSDVDPAFAAIVHRALEKDPARRFQSAGEMRAAVEPFARATVAGAAPASADARVAGRVLAGAATETDAARQQAHVAPTVLGGPLLATSPSAAAPATVGALPKTAEQPVAPPSVARDPTDANDARRASARHVSNPQRGTPVTTSRTLAKPAGAARWPWVLAAAAVAGGACAGTGLFVTTFGLGPPPPPAAERASVRPPERVRAVAPASLAPPPASAIEPDEPAFGGGPAPSPPLSVSGLVEPALVPVGAAGPGERASTPSPSPPRAVPAPPRSLPRAPRTSPVGAVVQAPPPAATPPPPETTPPTSRATPVSRASREVRVQITRIDVGQTFANDFVVGSYLRNQLPAWRPCFRNFALDDDLTISYHVDVTAHGAVQFSSRGGLRRPALDGCVENVGRLLHMPPPLQPGRVVVTIRSTRIAEDEAPSAD